jgi:hypothetical protein
MNIPKVAPRISVITGEKSENTAELFPTISLTAVEGKENMEE